MKNKVSSLLSGLGVVISATAFAQNVTLTNPLGTSTTFRSLLNSVFTNLYQILLVVIPIVIVAGAFQMLFSTGDPEKFKKGQKTIVYAVIGLVVILLAQGIVAIVENIFSSGV